MNNLKLGAVLALGLLGATPVYAAAGLDGLRNTVATGINNFIDSWFGDGNTAYDRALETAAHRKAGYVDSPNFPGDTFAQRDEAFRQWAELHSPTISNPVQFKWTALPTNRRRFYVPRGMTPGAMWRYQGLYRSDAFGSGNTNGGPNNNTRDTNDVQGSRGGRNGPE